MGEPLFGPVNLLILAENKILRNQFIEDLRGFLQDEKYEPKKQCEDFDGHTTFNVGSRRFHIIIGPFILESDTPNDILSKSHELQEHFIRPFDLNAIIFLMQPDPKGCERFLSQILFNYFNKDDIPEMEKNVMFVFMHDNPEYYQRSYVVDADLWTILERNRVDLLHSKTFHCNSRLNKDSCNTFVQFIYKNKQTLRLETLYSHESVIKLVEKKDNFDVLIEALFLNEDNIHEKGRNYLNIWNDSKYVCNNDTISRCKMNNYCSRDPWYTCMPCDDICVRCKCSRKFHKFVNYIKLKFGNYTADQQPKFRYTIITIIVTIDLFCKENYAAVSQLCHKLMERIKLKAHYSVLENLYDYEMSGRKKGITSDECMKHILEGFERLKDFIQMDDDFKYKTLMAGGNLRVKR